MAEEEGTGRDHIADAPQHLLGGLQVAMLGASPQEPRLAAVKGALEQAGVVVTFVPDTARHVDADAFDAVVAFGGDASALQEFIARMDETGKPVVGVGDGVRRLDAAGRTGSRLADDEADAGLLDRELRRLLAARRRMGGATAADDLTSSVGEDG